MTIIEKRLHVLREKFSALQLEGLLVTNPVNVRWLSGFTGSYARLLITHDQALLGTDSRYWIRARAEAPDFALFKDNRTQKDAEALLKQGQVKRVGLEAAHVTLAAAAELEKVEGITWIPVKNVVEVLRQYKNVFEIENIQAAAAITDNAMALVPQLVRSGISERELAWQLEKTMHEFGADGVAFPIIVAFGPNSALPHHNPGDKVLNEEEIVLIDMGAELNGYKSDMTRSFFYGRKNDRFQEIYDLVHAALNDSLQGVRDGAISSDVNQLAMDTITNGGHGEYFKHGLGHGIGLDIHEIPLLSRHHPPSKLAKGMVITIEPGIYHESWGGIRIEDLITVTNDGYKVLSKCPKIPYIHP